jgi:hypothetical protein
MLREIALFGAGVPSVLLYFLAPVALFLAVDQLPKLNLAVYDRGETLVKPGRVLNALFLIGRGVLSATCDAIEGEIELERSHADSRDFPPS